MTLKTLLMSSASICALVWQVPSAGAEQAIAETDVAESKIELASQAEVQSSADDEAPEEIEEIVVRGVRGSVSSALEVKRNARQVVDSIVSQDIGKLPDNNIIEALARVTGVQVTRSTGEANSLQIRGLPNVKTFLNGRDLVTSTGRSFALQDIPAELVKGVDVYKSSAPDQIAGGIAGVIDVRLNRPLDFDGFHVAGGLRNVYTTQAKEIDPIASFLVSDRWETGIGEIGALLALSFQRPHFEDQTTFNFISLPAVDPATGSDIILPLTTGNIFNFGKRARPAGNFTLQWRPDNQTDIYLDTNFFGFRNENNLDFFIGIPSAGALTSVTLRPETFEGRGIPKTSITENAFTLTSKQAFKDRTNTWNLAIGGERTMGDFEISTEVAVTRSTFVQKKGVILDTAFIAPELRVDFDHEGRGTPFVEPIGIDVTDPSNFTLNQLFDNHTRSFGKAVEWRTDLTYSVEAGPITGFKTGFRINLRDLFNRASNASGSPVPGVIPADSVEGLADLSPKGFLRNVPVQQFFVASRSFLLNETDTLRALFGRPQGQPPSFPPNAFDDQENQFAGYGQADFAFRIGSVPVDGFAGLRVIHTSVDLSTFQSGLNDPLTGPFERVNVEQKFTNFLPSINARFELDQNLFFRFGAGRTVSRPNFDDLNPSLSLTTPGPTLIGSGNGGNPELKNIKFWSLDGSLEWYFAEDSLLSIAGFFRDMKGFIQTFSSNETINGQEFNVSRPRNTGTGELKGVEVAYTQFFDFPAWLSWLQGFGVQLNGTFIQAKTQVPPNEQGVIEFQRLTDVSNYSMNAVFIYERGLWSGRLGWNWRDRYLLTRNTGGEQLEDVLEKSIGQLDFSGSYDLSENFTLTLDARNILDNTVQNFFGDPNLFPRDTRSGDQTIEFGFRFRFQ